MLHNLGVRKDMREIQQLPLALKFVASPEDVPAHLNTVWWKDPERFDRMFIDETTAYVVGRREDHFTDAGSPRTFLGIFVFSICDVRLRQRSRSPRCS
ncbi:MAG: hypothetical protein AAGF12_30325 [Myxococcota bacterium]